MPNTTPPPNANPHVYNAIKERGRLFLLTFRELSKRYGEPQAVDIMRKVAHDFGWEIGEQLAHNAPRDFAGLAEQDGKSPDGGATFSTDIRRLDSTCLEMQMMTCPIKDAWVDAGCSDTEICTLLYCASALDEAKYEAAGFAYEIELWAPGKQGCCLTKIWEKTDTTSNTSL